MTHTIGAIPDPAGVANQLAIQEVLACHSRGLDRGDPALIQACYWPEAQVDYGAFKGPAHQFAGLVVPALAENYQLTRHCLGNTLVDLAGHQARVETLVTAWHLLPSAREEMVFSGRYLDAFTQRDNCWKIFHRQVVMDWSRRLPVEDERQGEAFSPLAKGCSGSGDPLYAFLEPSAQT